MPETLLWLDFTLILQKLIRERHDCYTAKVGMCPCSVLLQWSLQHHLSHVPAICSAKVFWTLVSCWTCCFWGLRALLESRRTLSTELFIKRSIIKIMWSFCFNLKADLFFCGIFFPSIPSLLLSSHYWLKEGLASMSSTLFSVPKISSVLFVAASCSCLPSFLHCPCTLLFWWTILVRRLLLLIVKITYFFSFSCYS